MMENQEEVIQINYEETGKGIFLVLLHGLGLNHTTWLPVAEVCSHAARVIMPDLRGHGSSFAPEGVYPMETMANDVKFLIDRLELDEIILGGHSMGGYVSLAFAEMFPERVKGLILISTNADADPPEKRDGRYLLAQKMRTEGSMALADTLAPKLTEDPLLVEKMRRMIAMPDARGLIGASLGIAERPDRKMMLSQLNCPILVIAGEDDKLTPLSAEKGICTASQNANLIILPGAGHLPMLEQPTLVAQTICEFIIQLT